MLAVAGKAFSARLGIVQRLVILENTAGWSGCFVFTGSQFPWSAEIYTMIGLSVKPESAVIER